MNRFKKLKDVDALIGLAITAAATIVLVPLAGSAGGVLAGAAGTTLTLQRRFYLDSLNARIERDDRDAEWSVACNGVKVGAISDAEYAGICRRVYGDWRLYWRQARAFARPINRLAGMLFTGIPLLAFWCGVAMLIAAPEIFASTMLELSKMSAGQAAKSLKAMSPVVGLYACGIAPFFGLFYTTNEFDQAIASEIGRHLGVVVYGKFSLTSIQKKEGEMLLATDLLS